MDQNLFKKHLIQIDKQKDRKQEVVGYIQEATGIILDEKDFSIEKKYIFLHTSSVVLSKLLQKKNIDFLESKGYFLKRKN